MHLGNVVVLAESLELSIEFVDSIFMGLSSKFGHSLRHLKQLSAGTLKSRWLTRCFCLSSKRFSASVLLDAPLLLLTTAGVFCPLPPPGVDRSLSPEIAFSTFCRSKSNSCSICPSLRLGFFFLLNANEIDSFNDKFYEMKCLLLHDTSICNRPLELKRASRPQIIIRHDGRA